MSVRKFGLGSIVVLVLGSAVLADYAVVGSKSDFEPRQSLVAISNIYDPGPSVTATNVRIGVSGAASNRVYGGARAIAEPGA